MSMTGCTLGIACVGEFEKGRGDFYDQESTNGKTILVRFLHLGHHARHGAIRAGIFRGRRQDLGNPTGSANIRGSHRSSL